MEVGEMSIRITKSESLSKDERLRLAGSDDDRDRERYYKMAMEDARAVVRESRQQAERRHVGFQAPKKKN